MGNLNIHATCVIVCHALAAQLALGQGVLVEVDASALGKPVDRRLFGSNVEWFYDGNQAWDASTDSPRPSVVDQARRAGVALLRFPGGAPADTYRWRDGVGSRALRPTTPHYLDAGSSKHRFGTHEFIEFCRRIGAEPMFQTNIVTGSASEARDWVEYVNAASHAERAANGSATPFGVKLWEIGNEPYLRDFAGTKSPALMTATAYAAKFVEFATAMKQADPSILAGAAGGANFGRYNLMEEQLWNRELLTRAGPHIDFLAVHNAYGPLFVTGEARSFDQVYEAMLAFPAQVERNLASINQDIEQYAPSHANRIQIAITEWGPMFSIDPLSPYVGHTKTLASGVFTASLLRVFLEAKRVRMANFFQLVHPLFSGSMNPQGVAKPSLLAIEMFARHFGSTLLKTQVTSPTKAIEAVGLVDSDPAASLVEAVSSVSPDRKRVYIMLINKSLYSPQDTELRVRNLRNLSSGTVRVLTGPAPDANNGNDLLAAQGLVWAPQAIAPFNSQFHEGRPGTIGIAEFQTPLANSMRFTLPPLSVVNLEFAPLR